MASKKVISIWARYNLRPEPITGVRTANLPVGEPTIALSQASTVTPVYLSFDMARMLSVELGYAGQGDIADRIKDEIKKVRAEEIGAGS